MSLAITTTDPHAQFVEADPFPNDVPVSVNEELADILMEPVELTDEIRVAAANLTDDDVLNLAQWLSYVAHPHGVTILRRLMALRRLAQAGGPPNMGHPNPPTRRSYRRAPRRRTVRRASAGGTTDPPPHLVAHWVAQADRAFEAWKAVR